MEPAETYQLFRQAFIINADPEKAAGMRQYMKNNFEFLGIPSSQRKDLQKEFFKSWIRTDRKFILELVDLLWASRWREFQYVACDLLLRSKKILEREDIVFLEKLILTKSWWDSVDSLSSLVGYHVLKHPDLQPECTDRWMSGDQLWLQRVALIHQLKFREQTDWEMLKRYCSSISTSKEFFLQKGAGWALRQYAKFKPYLVRDFIRTHQLPNLTKREASKYL